ncbi:Der GTPase-activating protein YihI [Vibrio mangrovi]|uniref:Der GTPase-activating protein YihI n=1 Tax=Vibrio mangrovi TaxID=474394 RepID=A0A1Y6IZJ0_9VIBR|nr:Der GTPase-activating protein YihI [Vibrio mangrovi]MDW6002565.1 Der GTPase-activating protein YihI [Vibrio mangrovi]SMS01902.1 Der GTPase-activating protein YihI [Vibrio mangrovi]
MSRKKKARSSGNTDVVVVRQRSQTDIEGRLRKKLKKRKGLKSGSRHSEESGAAARLTSQPRDPRLGSKKKIPLVVEAQPELTTEKRYEQAEQELALLENDAQLNVLLARLDQGEKLGAGLQQYVDEKLNRIEQLMKQLGLFDGEDELEDEVSPQPARASKKSASDDELLEKFTGFDPDDFQ